MSRAEHLSLAEEEKIQLIFITETLGRLVSPQLAGCAGAAVSLTLAAPDRLTTIDTLYFRSAETASAGTRVRDLKSAALTLSVFL